MTRVIRFLACTCHRTTFGSAGAILTGRLSPAASLYSIRFGGKGIEQVQYPNHLERLHCEWRRIDQLCVSAELPAPPQRVDDGPNAEGVDHRHCLKIQDQINVTVGQGGLHRAVKITSRLHGLE